MKAPLQAPMQEKPTLQPYEVQGASGGHATRDAGFTDNRPAAVAQRALQAMIGASAGMLQQKASSDAIEHSPQMLAQRRQRDVLFGAAAQTSAQVAQQLKSSAVAPAQLFRAGAVKSNRTGLPDQLKSGVESMSGMSMDHVRVHYNSSKPSQLRAHAYAQGADIYVASGQEKYVPHEAWHVVQQAQGRVRPTRQLKGGVSLNDDRALEREADVMGDLARRRGAAPVPASTPLAGAAPGQRAVQRQIIGLESYAETPEEIPDAWVDAYRVDIRHPQTHLSDEQLLQMYRHRRGGNTPDMEHVAFNHIDGNHWDVQSGGRRHTTVPDGSCAIHAVDLADRMLNSLPVGAPHAAHGDVLTEMREHLAGLAMAEDPLEIRRVIAASIARAEFVAGAGFGPDLSVLVNAEATRRVQQLFEFSYENLKWKDMGLPKPSEAKKTLSKKTFFKKKFGSLISMMQQALAVVHKHNNAGVGLTFEDPVYETALKTSIAKSLPHFYSASKAKAALGKIKKVERTSLSKKKYKLADNRFLSAKDRKKLREKLKTEKFRLKVMQASAHARDAMERKGADIGDVVRDGQLDLSSHTLTSTQKFGAFKGLKEYKGPGKRDLQFGLPGSKSMASFGQGGYQVKGLGTYAAEAVWFGNKLQEWKCSQEELFSAMQEGDHARLMQLVGNAADVNRLLRFEELQDLERWRAGPFGVGVAAWARMGYHGASTFSGYMQSMPMREEAATTNVSNTSDYAQPHHPVLWQQQQQSMVDGLQHLMEVEIGDGQTYDESTLRYLQNLAAQTDDSAPDEQMIEHAARFMSAPIPYQNAGDDEDAASQGGMEIEKAEDDAKTHNNP